LLAGAALVVRLGGREAVGGIGDGQVWDQPQSRGGEGAWRLQGGVRGRSAAAAVSVLLKWTVPL